MKYYTSTQYKDLTADRLGEGKDWFRIKVGDYVISREHHDIFKPLDEQEALVIATDRKSVTFRDYETGYSCVVLQEDIYRVTRKLKTKTIKAIFPSNWCDDDLRACEYRKNGDVWTLKVADLELHLKTYDFEENNDDDEITDLSGVTLDDSSDLAFTFNDVKQKKTEMQAEYEAQTYARNRKEEYNALNQLELISDDTNNGTTTHIDAVNAIKAKWPKDNSGPV